jgi:PadR family transcriptional regulator, regulatory protein PadR
MARMTHNALLVLRALAAEPDREMYGFEIMRAISLPSGTVYPLLDRVEAAGWAETRAEDMIPQDEGRPRRKYYRITPEGAAAVGEEMKREAARLSALGVSVSDRQPPGIVSVVSAGLDRDGEPVASAAHMDIGADGPDPDPGNCAHPRVHVKGTCPDCLTYVASKP